LNPKGAAKAALFSQIESLKFMTIVDDAIALGLPCFPCRGNKAPACPRGFKNAAEGADAIRELWRQWPGSLIGIPAGAVSGFDVLDIDKGAGGGDWYVENAYHLPATRIHHTRSGGWHLLFYADPRVKCSASLIAPGVDVRASGGYIIWWPATGLPARDYPPEGLPDWPAWLLEAILPKPEPAIIPIKRRHGTFNLHGIVRIVHEAREGERNRALYWGACRLEEACRKGLITADYAVDLLIEVATRRGLSYNEAVATVRSAFGGRSHRG
jgi:hypothetical protein